MQGKASAIEIILIHRNYSITGMNTTQILDGFKFQSTCHISCSIGSVKLAFPRPFFDRNKN